MGMVLKGRWSNNSDYNNDTPSADPATWPFVFFLFPAGQVSSSHQMGESVPSSANRVTVAPPTSPKSGEGPKPSRCKHPFSWCRLSLATTALASQIPQEECCIKRGNYSLLAALLGMAGGGGRLIATPKSESAGHGWLRAGDTNGRAAESHPGASACWGAVKGLASPKRNVAGSGKDSEV